MGQYQRAADPYQNTSVNTDELREDLLAAYAASKELPSSQERAIVMSFLERLDQTLDARIDARLNDMVKKKKLGGGNPTGTVAAALVLSIPLLAIAGGIAGTTGVVAVMAAVLILCLVAMTNR